MTPTSTKRIRSVVGAAMLGIGAFVLRENLDLAWARLNHVVGLGEGPGLVTTLTMTATRSWQAYAVNRLQFVHDSLLPVLASCWPLLLIVAGAFLSRDIFSGDCDELQKDDCGNVDMPRQFGDIQ